MRKIAFVCLIVLATLGCRVVTVDVQLTLHIEGTVTSQLGELIEGAEVRFFDTGIDQWRQSSGISLLVGYTNNEGKISSTLPYFFGYEIRGKSQPDLPGTFDLTIEAKGFSTARVPYKVSLLPRKDGVRILNFEVQLQETPSE